MCLTDEMLLASAVDGALSLLSAAGRVWQDAESHTLC